MGTDIVVQVGLMPGVRIGAVSELRVQDAMEAIVMSGRERGDIVQASTAADIDRAIETNRVAVTETTRLSARPGTSTWWSTPRATPTSARWWLSRPCATASTS